CLGLLERDLSHAEAMLAEASARAKQRGYTSSTLQAADGLLRLQRGDDDAADALFEGARTQARAASERFHEIQALLSRVQLNFDAGRPALALELGLAAEQLADKTRDGSEGPFARVLVALALLGLGQGDAGALERALDELRVADAKYRMTYGLSRAAWVFNRR